MSIVVSTVVDILYKTDESMQLVSSRCDVVCVIQAKTVVLSAIVAQKPIAVFAVPYSLMPLMFISMAVVTAMNFLSTPHRKVSSTESLCWMQCGTTRTLATAVLSDQTLCQLCAKGLDVFDVEISVVLGQYVAVYDSNIKKKPKYVLVVLPALEANMVIASQLIVVVDTSHGNSLSVDRCGRHLPW